MTDLDALWDFRILSLRTLRGQPKMLRGFYWGLEGWSFPKRSVVKGVGSYEFVVWEVGPYRSIRTVWEDE